MAAIETSEETNAMAKNNGKSIVYTTADSQEAPTLTSPIEKKKRKHRKKKKRKRSEERMSSDISKVSNNNTDCTSRHPKRSKHHHHVPTTLLPKCRPAHNFTVDEADHCETPMQAYRDIAPLLDKICALDGKKRASLVIYDPYYCNGGTKKKLGSLGFTNVVNENRDFYQDVAQNSIPPYDVLITNPPYSGAHMERLLKFVWKSKKPHLLLLPHYVYTKDYYKKIIQESHFFFFVPPTRYNYEPPGWTNHETGSTALIKGKFQTAPFPSFWYCHVDSVDKDWLERTFGKSGVFHNVTSSSSKMQYASCTNHLPRQVKGEFDPTKKRPNPRARKRLAAKRKAAAAVRGGGTGGF